MDSFFPNLTGVMCHDSEDEEEINEEKKAIALAESWRYFLDLAEESHEVVNQPLALIAAPANDMDPILCCPLVVRVDRSSSIIKTDSPLPVTPIMDAFESWLGENAPNAVTHIGQVLAESSGAGEWDIFCFLYFVKSRCFPFFFVDE